MGIGGRDVARSVGKGRRRAIQVPMWSPCFGAHRFRAGEDTTPRKTGRYNGSALLRQIPGLRWLPEVGRRGPRHRHVCQYVTANDGPPTRFAERDFTPARALPITSLESGRLAPRAAAGRLAIVTPDLSQ